MEEKKNTQIDSTQKTSKTPTSDTVKQRSVKSKMPRTPKSPIPHTDQDCPFEPDDYSYYRDDNAGD